MNICYGWDRKLPEFHGNTIVYVMVPEYGKIKTIVSHVKNFLAMNSSNACHVICVPRLHMGCIKLVELLGYSHILLNDRLL
jgi:hypothetical protein